MKPEFEIVSDYNIDLLNVHDSYNDIADCARVSTGKDCIDLNDKKEKNKRLLIRLMTDNHMSPFEMMSFIFRIECPIFVARQLFRHRTLTTISGYDDSDLISNFDLNSSLLSYPLNEFSHRYSTAKLKFSHLNTKKQCEKNKQCSSNIDLECESKLQFQDRVTNLYRSASTLYADLIGAGVSRENARAVLPMASLTTFISKISFRHLGDFLSLRLANDVQSETRLIAKKMYDLVIHNDEDGIGKALIHIVLERNPNIDLKALEC